MKKLIIIPAVIAIFCIIGEVKCIIKMVNCDWNPIGKAEVLYTAGAFTGFGAIIGYLDIEDAK